MAVSTVSGGGGAWMSDVLTANGLLMPSCRPAPGKNSRLHPGVRLSQNPIDTTAQGANTGPMQMRTLELLETADEIDMIVMVSSMSSETRASLDPERVRPVLERGNKPVVTWSYTLPSTFGRNHIAKCGMFLHSDLRACGQALGKVAEFAERLRLGTEPAPKRDSQAHLPAGLPRVLTEHRVKQVLVVWAAEIIQRPRPVGRGSRRRGGDSRLPRRAQDPVARHPAQDRGRRRGRLNLTDANAVQSAYREIIAAAERYRPGATIEGVLVQRMAPKGYEIVIGTINDDTFGPVVMVGFGGTTVELFGDVVHRPAPISEADAARMVRGLRSARLLEGFRGARVVDIAPLAALIARISEAAVDHRGRVREMEFNPVILHADGSGLTIADALMTLED